MTLICGIDEAGRGPLAGPVTAAAVILPPDFASTLLNDSKKLSPQKREACRALIQAQALFIGEGRADHIEIDAINILQATLLAMKRAFDDLYQKVLTSECRAASIRIIVDGNKLPDFLNPSIIAAAAEPKADAKYPEVMAASIIAKTTRDMEMLEWAKKYPQYGYEKHKGYCTAAHVQAIKNFGFSPIQRKTFKIPELKN
ncbi:ribonuclease HII [Treponema phagedenis]|uniref:Ribonuclease n=1 Tax=Treponema phagedenis TaxID=162 RepID=A0A0B7H087_TREPH|nr:ribonuclease HII [Treponema phagedenis]EFW37896.1 ribonuclease HII [Treponema phagedenis F0421]NVP25294.1 ribonuclease HII [Treponema phagedenis]NVP25670.1 ribonuclease HII [Treponema phagedenis]QEJ96278.1 ribonuclease HII [Treponema phagedenis]QEJ97029.1 ribonuclease HII [Treponema phagedenis]